MANDLKNTRVPIYAGADPDCSERSSSISQIFRESVHKSFEK